MVCCDHEMIVIYENGYIYYWCPGCGKKLEISREDVKKDVKND